MSSPDRRRADPSRRGRNTRRRARARRHRAARRRQAASASEWRAKTPSSEIHPQIHAVVEAGNFVGIAVEGQGGVATGTKKAAFADAPLGRLAPARMVDSRIDVGIETVLLRIGDLPG